MDIVDIDRVEKSRTRTEKGATTLMAFTNDEKPTNLSEMAEPLTSTLEAIKAQYGVGVAIYVLEHVMLRLAVSAWMGKGSGSYSRLKQVHKALQKK